MFCLLAEEQAHQRSDLYEWHLVPKLDLAIQLTWTVAAAATASNKPYN